MASIWDYPRAVGGAAISGLGSALHLPEMGLSENIIGKPTPQAMQNLETQSAVLGAQKSNMAGQVLGQGTTGPTVNLNPSAPAVSGGGGDGGTAAALAQVNAEWEAATGTLNRQGEETSQQYGLYQTQAGTQAQQATAEAEAAQGKQITGLNTSQQTVGQNTQSAIGQARQAYNELQQRNNAYTSALGISSSSAAEAMQEGLSRNTLNALNNLTQNKDTALQTIEVAKKDVNDFYGRQINNIQTNLKQTQDQLGLELRVQMGKINDSKNLATLQKQQMKNGLISQAATINAAASAEASQKSAAWNTWQQFVQENYSNTAGYAGGKVSLDAFNATNDKIDAGLRGTGLQVDRANIYNSLAQGQTPTSYFTTTTAPKTKTVTDKNGNVFLIDEQTGQTIKQW